MHLEIGDRLLVTGHEGDTAGHVCRVVSAAGADGSCLVLRYDTGAEELLVPGPDLDIRVLHHTSV
jgi:hypothetical protein